MEAVLKEPFLHNIGRNNLLSAFITSLLAAPGLLLSGGSACGVELSAHSQSALATIVGEDVLSLNTSHTRRKSASLTVEQRYQMLSDWVLPNGYRQTFRFRGAFSQTHPPHQHDLPGSGGRRDRFTGSRPGRRGQAERAIGGTGETRGSDFCFRQSRPASASSHSVSDRRIAAGPCCNSTNSQSLRGIV
jgi:hypothetical protein